MITPVPPQSWRRGSTEEPVLGPCTRVRSHAGLSGPSGELPACLQLPPAVSGPVAACADSSGKRRRAGAATRMLARARISSEIPVSIGRRLLHAARSSGRPARHSCAAAEHAHAVPLRHTDMAIERHHPGGAGEHAPQHTRALHRPSTLATHIQRASGPPRWARRRRCRHLRTAGICAKTQQNQLESQTPNKMRRALDVQKWAAAARTGTDQCARASSRALARGSWSAGRRASGGGRTASAKRPFCKRFLAETPASRRARRALSLQPAPAGFHEPQ